MSKGIVIGEQCHVINAFAPLDINGSARVSDVWSMENYSHATIIVQLGVTGAATTITVEECDDFDPTNNTAIAFSYYAEVTAAGDTLSTRTAALVGGITGSTNDGVMYVIEIDASQLSDGYPNLIVKLSDPAQATLASIVVILSGARYAQEESATAIV